MANASVLIGTKGSLASSEERPGGPLSSYNAQASIHTAKDPLAPNVNSALL